MTWLTKKEDSGVQTNLDIDPREVGNGVLNTGIDDGPDTLLDSVTFEQEGRWVVCLHVRLWIRHSTFLDCIQF